MSVSPTGAYPRFTLANKTADDGARYFGALRRRGETRAAIDAVCAAFRLPTCTRRFPRDIGKERPCLNHHMGRCDGFCRGEPDAEEYQKRRIEQACSLLSGHYKTLARELKTEMEHEAKQLHFEQAAVLRDRIAAIEVLGKRQKVIAGVCADTDVWGLYTGAAKSGCAIVHVEDGSVTGRETSIFAAPTDETEADTLSALLSQYYLPRGVLPREILCPLPWTSFPGWKRCSPPARGIASRCACRSAAKRRSCLPWRSATPVRRSSASPPPPSARTKRSGALLPCAV